MEWRLTLILLLLVTEGFKDSFFFKPGNKPGFFFVGIICFSNRVTAKV